MPNNTRERPGARPRLQVDVARYQGLIDDPEISEEQKRAFLEALWVIINAFVDLGFGVHPVQQACGQVDDFAAEYSKRGEVMLDFKDHARQQFKDAAGHAAEEDSHEGRS